MRLLDICDLCAKRPSAQLCCWTSHSARLYAPQVFRFFSHGSVLRHMAKAVAQLRETAVSAILYVRSDVLLPWLSVLAEQMLQRSRSL